MSFRYFSLSLFLFLISSAASAQGKIAVVNLEEAIMQTDYAQERMSELSEAEDFAADRSEFESLQKELDQRVKDFQRDQAAMSDDQKDNARQKLASKQADLEYVAKKLQALQTQFAQRIFQELVPNAREVLRQVIETEQIGLLLQQQSVIHADLGYNITAKITDKLNQLPIVE